MSKKLFMILFVVWNIAGCKKTAVVDQTSSLCIVNAIPNSNPLLMSFAGSPNLKNQPPFFLFNEYQRTGGIYFGSYAEMGYVSGPTQLSLVQVSDTLDALYTGNFTLVTAGMYTLYLTGTDTSHIDTLFSKESIPYYPPNGDSIMGIRFIHLSTGSNPISVDISGSANNTPIISSLSYKQESAFGTLPADNNSMQAGYTFEFRDLASGELLSTYPVSVLPFSNQTLGLIGNSTIGYSVVEINNY